MQIPASSARVLEKGPPTTSMAVPPASQATPAPIVGPRSDPRLNRSDPSVATSLYPWVRYSCPGIEFRYVCNGNDVSLRSGSQTSGPSKSKSWRLASPGIGMFDQISKATCVWTVWRSPVCHHPLRKHTRSPLAKTQSRSPSLAQSPTRLRVDS